MSRTIHTARVTTTQARGLKQNGVDRSTPFRHPPLELNLTLSLPLQRSTKHDHNVAAGKFAADETERAPAVMKPAFHQPVTAPHPPKARRLVKNFKHCHGAVPLPLSRRLTGANNGGVNMCGMSMG
jgi:hypothetical protein